MFLYKYVPNPISRKGEILPKKIIIFFSMQASVVRCSDDERSGVRLRTALRGKPLIFDSPVLKT
jgi:hypothetical protein